MQLTVPLAPAVRLEPSLAWSAEALLPGARGLSPAAVGHPLGSGGRHGRWAHQRAGVAPPLQGNEAGHSLPMGARLDYRLHKPRR